LQILKNFQHPPFPGIAYSTLPETDTWKTSFSIEGRMSFHVFPLSDDLKMPSNYPETF